MVYLLGGVLLCACGSQKTSPWSVLPFHLYVHLGIELKALGLPGKHL